MEKRLRFSVSQFEMLRHLGLARSGAAPYYLALSQSSDEIVCFGAVMHLLAHRALPLKDWPLALDHSKWGAIKQRAFDYFETNYEHQLAAQVSAVAVDSFDEATEAMMRAELAHDHEGALAGAVRLFRATGEARFLFRAAEAAERIAGWRAQLEWLLRASAIFPLEPLTALKLFASLSNANQYEQIEQLARAFSRAQLHTYIVDIFSAAAALSRGEAEQCLARLARAKAPAFGGGKALRDVENDSYRLAGDAHDKLGNYRRAYASYIEMNKRDTAPAIDRTLMVKTNELLANIAVPQLPQVRRDDVVMMLGFPRSGTTLLENALSAHPEIETLEEAPTWDAAMQWFVSRWREAPPKPADKPAFFGEVRSRYFEEVARFRRRGSARIVVDKYPLRTSSAAMLSKLIPEQKYIFSIRHPFDVALSCFRHRFAANPAMEYFHTLATTVELYDFALSQWFGVHDLSDPKVHYLKYDRLVTDFRPSIEGVLSFVGVDWNDDVLNFAERSELRPVRTPSYAKVRQGLSIGVQTAWRNYGFLFNTPEAKPLHKWAEFFGYPTT